MDQQKEKVDRIILSILFFIKFKANGSFNTKYYDCIYK